MNRDYDTGNSEQVIFFVGTEVEHTPAYGMKTLFVTGIQSTTEIKGLARQHDCTHIFFGANHSFNPSPTDYLEWTDWEGMIEDCIKAGFLCSLDIPIALAEPFLEGPLVEQDTFIPQLRVPVPYIKQWNYNTMLKIDDKGFKASNPGVWCHRLHNLMDEEKFTPWSEYGLDKIIR